MGKFRLPQFPGIEIDEEDSVPMILGLLTILAVIGLLLWIFL